MGASTHNRKRTCMITPGVHCSEITIARGVVYPSQETGRNSTHQSSNTTCAPSRPSIVPMAMGCSILLHAFQPMGGICWLHRPTCHNSAKTLTCWWTLSLSPLFAIGWVKSRCWLRRKLFEVPAFILFCIPCRRDTVPAMHYTTSAALSLDVRCV